jgi:hypothetical protein
MHKWWSALPEYAKGIALTAIIGAFGWLVALGVPVMKKALYQHILWKLGKIKESLELWHAIYDEPQTPRDQRAYVSSDEVIEKAHYPRWLVKRAVRWQERQLLKNEKPPFSL